MEVAAELYDLIKEDLSRFYPQLAKDISRVRLVELQDHILSTYDREISDYTAQLFGRCGFHQCPTSQAPRCTNRIPGILMEDFSQPSLWPSKVLGPHHHCICPAFSSFQRGSGTTNTAAVPLSRGFLSVIKGDEAEHRRFALNFLPRLWHAWESGSIVQLSHTLSCPLMEPGNVLRAYSAL